MSDLLNLEVLAERVESGDYGKAGHHQTCWSIANALGVGDDVSGHDLIDAILTEGSLDATLSLHNAVLPGWHWLIRDDQTGEGQFANVFPGDPNDGGDCWYGYADTPAAAWVAAILRAKAQEE